MTILILAEKPDQAEAYGKALGQVKRSEGVLIVENSAFFDGEIRIVAAQGHLFEYKFPKIPWKLENLPIVDMDFQLTLIKDDKVKKRFNLIKQEVKIAREIIIGTDADREGERIAYTILSQIPQAIEKIGRRLWVHSMTTAGIQKAFGELREAGETRNYYEEAEARAQSDWYVGFNLSPLVTLDLQQQHRIAREKGNTMSVGRVQTPVVRLICENDESIRTFVSEPYWKLHLEDVETGTKFTTKAKYLDHRGAVRDLISIPKELTISEIVETQVEKGAPLLFDLKALQSYGIKRWKKSAAEILKIAQSLYMKKVLTYARTDCRVITPFEFDYLKENVTKYQSLLGFYFPLENMEARESYVNEDEVGEHYAIVPTDVLPDLRQLTQDERLVYETVSKRTMLMFAGDYCYTTVKATITWNGDSYNASGREVTSLGYMAYENRPARKNKGIPKYDLDQIIKIKADISEDKTKPPERLSEATLLELIFPKYHLGTPATRSGIIETIQKRGYVRKDKQTGKLFPTEKGRLLNSYMKNNQFSKPDNTKGWEYFLKEVGKGTLSKEKFVSAIQENIIAQVNDVKNKEKE